MTLRSFGALFMWLNVFYYMRGFRRTGPYVRTILEVFNDMLGFLVLYVLMWIGFSHAFFMVSSASTPGEAILEMGTIVQLTYRLGTLGDFDGDDFEGVSPYRYVLFLGCTVLITIIFLNVRRMHLNFAPRIAITRGQQSLRTGSAYPSALALIFFW